VHSPVASDVILIIMNIMSCVVLYIVFFSKYPVLIKASVKKKYLSPEFYLFLSMRCNRWSGWL
jgi:hypothetical protein